ncbi:hypothetical protein J6590_086993 [Homalodisca vitripennis]|nr:hypothetical protein J6590_086993 [Homalodisca vitripennis]
MEEGGIRLDLRSRGSRLTKLCHLRWDQTVKQSVFIDLRIDNRKPLQAKAPTGARSLEHTTQLVSLRIMRNYQFCLIVDTMAGDLLEAL